MIAANPTAYPSVRKPALHAPEPVELEFARDTLKIDHSFVRDLATDADSASLVSAVTSMGKSLHQHSCPDGQGRYFSHPVLAGESPALLGCAVRDVAQSAAI
jgi:hypothetical protein